MALCMDRIYHLWYLHLHDWTNWRDIPYQLPCCEQSFVWDLGFFMACIQPSSYGLHLVWRSGMDWRSVSDYIHQAELWLMTYPGLCVTLMIRSIWTSYEDVPNGLPASSGTNTKDFVSFFLFWFCSLPAIWFPVHQIRHLFTVKAYFVPVAGLVFFIWAIVRAKGIGPIVHQPSSKTGSALGWAIVQGIMSSIANFATL